MIATLIAVYQCVGDCQGPFIGFVLSDWHMKFLNPKIKNVMTLPLATVVINDEVSHEQ